MAITIQNTQTQFSGLHKSKIQGMRSGELGLADIHLAGARWRHQYECGALHHRRCSRKFSYAWHVIRRSTV